MKIGIKKILWNESTTTTIHIYCKLISNKISAIKQDRKINERDEIYLAKNKIKLNDWIINSDFFCYSNKYNIQTGNQNTRLHPDYV